MFEDILKQVGGGAAVGDIASKLGIDPDMASKAVEALGQAHNDPRDTIEVAQEKSGIDAAMLGQVRDLLGGDGSLAKIANLLDRDGDGNPLDDVADMAKGLFGKN